MTDLDTLEKLHAAATPGEWRTSRYLVESDDSDIASTCHAPNAALVVAAHNALPELIERVRRAEKIVDRCLRIRECCRAFEATDGTTPESEALQDEWRRLVEENETALAALAAGSKAK